VVAASFNMTELGTTGLKRSSGVVIDEPIVALRGSRGRKIYTDMATDSVISAFIFAVEKVIGGLEWRVDPGEVPESELAEADETKPGKPSKAEEPDEEPDARDDLDYDSTRPPKREPKPAPPPTPEEEAAEFIEQCLFDMSDSWESTIAEILSCLTYGWSYHEILYKRRVGPDETDPTKKSAHTDKRIGWRKFAPRAQETIWQWEFDDDGGIQAMIQVDQYAGRGVVNLPIQKSLLFRTTSRRGNPEGVSMLRGAYRPWYFRKRIEEIEAIGIERDLAGLPVAWVDPAFLADNATPAQKQVIGVVTDIVQNIKRNEQEGVVYPLAYDERGNKMFDLTLLSSGGSRQFDTDAIVGRYDNRIAMSVLADWLLLGHEGVGSFALGTSKMSMWTMSVDAIAKTIAGVINDHAIPRLLHLNAIKVDRAPKLAYGDVNAVDLTALADFVSKFAGSGILTPDDALEAHLRDAAGLPPAENPVAHVEAADQAQAQAAQAQQDALALAQVAHGPGVDDEDAKATTTPKPKPGKKAA
jgi:hypothetical protein